MSPSVGSVHIVVNDNNVDSVNHVVGAHTAVRLAAMQSRTRPYHHGDLRAALLARAEETLGDRGPAALSLRELARDLGVSHNAPSRHFKDKEALLDALALGGYERMTETMLAARRGAGESCREKLEAVARAYVGFSRENAALLDLMCSVRKDARASAALLEAGRRWAELIEGLMREGQRQGEVREGPLEWIGVPVFAALHGFAGLAATGMIPPEAAERGLDEAIAFILRGCAPDGRA
ncbi:TetR/AcrR family transcriptional regulator [Streptomyces sp. NPDC001985]|uniref:TetR/AcrR family transcriptional regulator n=1 Tax=Streptomyces sp. NPDC001985 TaxID=3154406 RepID=UPI00331F6D17